VSAVYWISKPPDLSSFVWQVVDPAVRERLSAHNYCRNPNPAMESRPWCFTGDGKQEYCDIPACGNIGATYGLDFRVKSGAIMLILIRFSRSQAVDGVRPLQA